ncbi:MULTISPECIES: DUF4915 domain-containing protein [unclassified Tychonema]|uniref:DUF4915 domain-containing protein n=1 Tax=unclassified Tychonema TaxID=2642144 RepID=UPI001D14EA83|nr:MULTISPECIES: DUF4915 domain-containing protein [unclassified Tychonema]
MQGWVAVNSSGQVIFICIATLSERHIYKPLWKPPFMSQYINEERCHPILNYQPNNLIVPAFEW